MNKINSVSFKNFRGLDDLTVPLSQVTMLTGSNGSGKTSVLEGFTQKYLNIFTQYLLAIINIEHRQDAYK